MYTAQGNFVCQENKDIIEHFAPLPDGLYQRNCRNCSYTQSKNGKNNELKCECMNIEQLKYKKTTLKNCYGNIENWTGNLTCK